MAKRSMNSIAGSSRDCPSSRSEYTSKSVREIDNGFVVSESCEKNGEYTSREYFTKNPDGRGPSSGGETLAGAIDECNK